FGARFCRASARPRGMSISVDLARGRRAGWRRNPGRRTPMSSSHSAVISRTDPADAQAIEASIELAAERGGDLTPQVYQRLFREQPEMEPLFWRDRNGTIKGEMLARVFEALFDFIGDRRYAD